MEVALVSVQSDEKKENENGKKKKRRWCPSAALRAVASYSVLASPTAYTDMMARMMSATWLKATWLSPTLSKRPKASLKSGGEDIEITCPYKRCGGDKKTEKEKPKSQGRVVL
ncbi:hypothetical protein CRUP_024141 [Coryphaenoides rupestris]|nr:hypothetical protein CRUP_024141 [Coryphaenoides rupestris]